MSAGASRWTTPSKSDCLPGSPPPSSSAAPTSAPPNSSSRARSPALVAYANRFPKLRLAFTGGFEDDGFVKFFSSPWTYAIGSIAGPVFDFGRNKRKYQAALARYDEAKYNYEQRVFTAFREVSDAASAMRSRRETTIRRRELREAARRYVELAYIQYRAGSIGYIDVLDAQRRYFDAETGLSNAVRDEYLALISLYKSLGGGWSATPK